jgi:capsular exopolysaccharide synthesis family protein
MDLRHFLSVLWRRVWLLVLAPLLAGAISLAVSMHMEPVYQASATLLIGQAGDSMLLDYSSLLSSERIATTYAELLSKRPILEQVISDLQLDLTPYQLAGKIDIVQPHDTQLLELRVEDSQPQLAIAIANSLVASFLKENSLRRNSDLTSYEQTLAQETAKVQDEILELEVLLEQENVRKGQNSLPDQADDRVPGLEASLREARLTYATLLGSYLQIWAAGGRSSYVEVVEPAAMPARKIRPRIVFNTFVVACAGLSLALGLAFLLDYLDDTFTRPENAEQALLVPTLAAIPSLQIHATKDTGPTAALQPMSPFAEAYRTLRTSLQFSNLDTNRRTLLVTSAVAEEGKTTTIANLGVVMAQAGRKVLLVDADLRRSMLHRVFHLPDQPGLTDLLLADAAPDESCLTATAISNLYVLPSGPLPPTPSELLGSERMNKLIGQLCTLADIVLFDSPPVLAVTDAAVLASHADGVLLVVESGRTPKEEARKALHSLQSVGARVLGTVLTQCKVEGRDYYYRRAGVRQGGIVGAISPPSFVTLLTARLKRIWLSVPFTGHRLSGSSLLDRDDGSGQTTV